MRTEINKVRLDEIAAKLETSGFRPVADYHDRHEWFRRFVNNEGTQIMLFVRHTANKEIDHYEVFREVSQSIVWSEYLAAI